MILALILSCSGSDGPSDAPDGVNTGQTGSTGVNTGDTGLPNLIACSAPSEREEMGPFELQIHETEPVSHRWIWGGAMMVGDLDGDGAHEIWATDESGLRAYTVQGNGLVEIDPPDHDLTGASGGAFADYDGDGDLDAYVTRWYGWPGPEGPDAGYNRLLRNEGDGTFTDVTESAGGVSGCLSDGTCLRSVPAAFGDIDRDGDLDLFVGSHGYLDPSGIPASQQGPGDASFLYINNGDGTFDTANLPRVMDRSYTLGGGFFDLDDDGWLDLYAANDVGQSQPNVVLWNEEGKFVYYEDKETSGLDIVGSSMGFATGDLNGDQILEAVIPVWGDVHYLESVPALDLWLDSTASRGIVADPEHVGWGSELLDIDNDGDLDLLTQFGRLDPVGNEHWANPGKQPDTLWINTGTPTEPSFVEEGAAWGVDDVTSNRGVATVDLNRDGYLDLIKLSLDGGLKVWMSRCGADAWLGIRLHQPEGLNPDAIGSRVRIEANGTIWTRLITAGGTSMGVGLPPELHVGLGALDTVDRIEVRWPDGTLTEWTDISTRQHILLTRE